MKRILYLLIILSSLQYTQSVKADVNIESVDSALQDKNNIKKVFEQGVAKYKKHQYEQSIKIFEKIIKKHPGFEDAYYYNALSHFEFGKYTLSIAYFLDAGRRYDAIEKIEQKHSSLYGAGLAYLSSGYIDEARNMFKKIVTKSKDPDLIFDSQSWLDSIDEDSIQKEKLFLLTNDLSFRVGVEAFGNQKFNLAVKSFQTTLKKHPLSLIVIYYLANSLYLLEKYDDAIENFEKIILINNDTKISRDSKLYIKVIRELTSSLPNTRPYYFKVSLGTNYDSNLSYADIGSTNISDMGTNLGFNATYNLNDKFRLNYNYSGNVFSGINDNTEGLNIFSRDFNLQKHSINFNFNYPINNKLLGEIDYDFNWFVLAGNNFLLGNSITPRINFFLNSNMVTVLQTRFTINRFPSLESRNSLNYMLSLYHYFYTLNNNLWFRVGYDLKGINANDKIQTTKGVLQDGSKYKLDYQFSNSLLSNSLSTSMGYNWIFNSKIKVDLKATFNNYNNPDIYRLTKPTTNITFDKQDELELRNVNKKRTDLLFNVGLNYSIPFSVPFLETVTANINYNYLINGSNITKNDYIGRSYVKHIFGLNINYNF